MVSKPIVVYLLDKGFAVTLGDMDVTKAQAIVGNHPNGKAIAFNVQDETLLNAMVSSS
jgi:uncharacterized protein (DUF1786 family)